jgi:hypothetical protein
VFVARLFVPLAEEVDRGEVARLVAESTLRLSLKADRHAGFGLHYYRS